MTQPVAPAAAPSHRSGGERFEAFVRRPGRLWLAFFAYAAAMAALVQLVVLPYIFPELHKGHGLLIEGDWVLHHRLTAEAAMRIREEGWSAWRLRPNGEFGFHGIPSAIYALITPEPWTLIPLHAALHATSTLLLVYILKLLVSSWRVAVLAALSFLLFPSGLITYTQITKDAYSICGGFMFLYGWLLLARWPDGFNRRQMIGVALLIAGGATLNWVARPYLVHLLITLSAGFATVVAIRMLVLGMRRHVAASRGVMVSAMAWLMVALLFPLYALGGTLYFTSSPSGAGMDVSGEAGTQANRAAFTAPWTASWWVPAAIDDRLYSLVRVRYRYRWRTTVGMSSVDLNVMPASVSEFVGYVPRLVALGFLAPFPAQWFQAGSFGSTTLMRRAVGVEMVLAYCAFASLVLMAARWRARLEFWFVLAYSGFCTLVLAFVFPNLGSLHRVRFGFLMVLVALGFAALLSRSENRGVGFATAAAGLGPT